MANNKGRIINFVTGITGISPGGQAVINMPVNQRYHRMIFQCTALNFTGGTNIACPTITGSGINLTADVTIAANHTVATIVPNNAGTGYVTGDTVGLEDATGRGFVGTVTAAGGVVSAIAITVSGTPSAIDPADFFSSIRLLVNGVNMRDITPDNINKISIANGYYPLLGECPLFFTSPWRNVNQVNDVTSWDLFGQSTFQVQLGISTTLVSPGLVGVNEFDYQRNLMPSADGKSLVPFLQPTAQHQFSFNIVAGRNDINTLPFNFPISRLWIYSDTPGSLYQLEIYQDGNKVGEFTTEQLKQSYREYGFNFGAPDWLNTTYPTSPEVQAAYQAPEYYDQAFISDPDQRWSKALRCDNSLIVRLYSTTAEKCTVVMETLPGSFAS